MPASPLVRFWHARSPWQSKAMETEAITARSIPAGSGSPGSGSLRAAGPCRWGAAGARGGARGSPTCRDFYFFLFAPPSASRGPPGMLACLPPVGFPRSQPSGLSPSPSAVPGTFPGFALPTKRRSEVGLCTIRSFLLLVWGLSFCWKQSVPSTDKERLCSKILMYLCTSFTGLFINRVKLCNRAVLVCDKDYIRYKPRCLILARGTDTNVFPFSLLNQVTQNCALLFLLLFFFKDRF